MKPLVVLKIGTAAITTPEGELNETVIEYVSSQLAVLQKTHHLIIVSSGAVALGKKYLKDYTGNIIDRKAAAALGNPVLVNKYTEAFKQYQVPIAQSLCERQHFSNRRQFLQLKETFGRLWKNGIIPIANENDVINNYELKFSDNDELATLLAVGFEASYLLLGTSVDGVLDHDNNLLKQIPRIHEDILSYARKGKSEAGLGGMVSKLNFAHLATTLGIKTNIFNIRKEGNILKAIRDETGTVCQAQPSKISARKKWLASGSLVSGRVQVDMGAVKALKNRKSLLAVGISKIITEFESNEIFEIEDADHNIIAVARAKTGTHTLMQATGKQNLEVAHADDIVIL